MTIQQIEAMERIAREIHRVANDSSYSRGELREYLRYTRDLLDAMAEKARATAMVEG